jgi:hypothetical protein
MHKYLSILPYDYANSYTKASLSKKILFVSRNEWMNEVNMKKVFRKIFVCVFIQVLQ